MNVLGLVWLSHASAWAWKTSLSASVLIFAVWISQRVFGKRMPVKLGYLLWLCALFRLILPFAPNADFSAIRLPQGILHPADQNAEPIWLHSTVAPKAAVPQVLTPPIELTVVPDAKQVRPRTSGTSWWLSAFPLLWAAGAALYFAVILHQHRRIARVLSDCQVPPGSKLARLVAQTGTSLGLKTPVQVCEILSSQPPSLFGFFRPRLIFPKALLDELSETELGMIILHELMHVKRKDVLLNWFMILVQGLHWFNPFAWLAMRRLRAAREMVCDAEVLAATGSSARQTYGETLIKLAGRFARLSAASSTVAIFSNQTEIHRRILMIAKFKPATRLAAFGSAIVILVVLCLAFTERSKAPTIQAPVNEIAGQTNAAVKTGNRIEILKRQLEMQTDRTSMLEAELEMLRKKYRITELEENGKADGASSRSQLLETLHVEAERDYAQVDGLLQRVQKLSKTEFRKVAPILVPDPVLSQLYTDLVLSEQKLADLNAVYAQEHPEVKRVRQVVEVVNRQINERLDGIVDGLRAKTAAAKEKAQNLDMEAERAKAREIERASARRPYLNVKRQLENQLLFKDKLQARLAEEELEAALRN
ncbi:MAG: hypothetical protein JWM16_1420 [Verrucomicrobiales bacterium]|nr:hypothetical protein [Verrucomicrobiales bacterium]